MFGLYKILDYRFFSLLSGIFLLAGCVTPYYVPPEPRYTPLMGKKLSQMGYTIQAGAFSRVENAARLTDKLNDSDLNAYYFAYEEGIYKVRFGNFPSREDARQRAENLQSEGIISEFYIVRPEEYSVSKREIYGEEYLRGEIVKTAISFRGVPYRWGGSSPHGGVDCSGLTMAVYRLNGLELPRTSREQYDTGTFVDTDNLSSGDLVFFETAGKGKISHVGIYVGNGSFVHAPGSGKEVREDRLSSNYYRRRYAGARSYL